VPESFQTTVECRDALFARCWGHPIRAFGFAGDAECGAGDTGDWNWRLPWHLRCIRNDLARGDWAGAPGDGVCGAESHGAAQSCWRWRWWMRWMKSAKTWGAVNTIRFEAARIERGNWATNAAIFCGISPPRGAVAGVLTRTPMRIHAVRICARETLGVGIWRGAKGRCCWGTGGAGPGGRRLSWRPERLCRNCFLVKPDGGEGGGPHHRGGKYASVYPGRQSGGGLSENGKWTCC